jgi:hypothetical protein
MKDLEIADCGLRIADCGFCHRWTQMHTDGDSESVLISFNLWLGLRIADCRAADLTTSPMTPALQHSVGFLEARQNLPSRLIKTTFFNLN